MELWDGFATPAWQALIEACGAGEGARLLDVGCGQGDFLAYAEKQGLVVAGAEPDPLAAQHARAACGGDVRVAGAEALPWPDGSFDLVTSFNALQFADDTDAGLAEMARVGGLVALVNWAEPELNDLEAIERALSDKSGATVEPSVDGEAGVGAGPGVDGEAGIEGEPDVDGAEDEGDLRYPGALERLLADGGLDLVTSGVVPLPLVAPDLRTLVTGILGDEEDHALAAAVRTAAKAFRGEDGSYRLLNHFRFVVGRRRPVPPAPPR